MIFLLSLENILSNKHINSLHERLILMNFCFAYGAFFTSELNILTSIQKYFVKKGEKSEWVL